MRLGDNSAALAAFRQAITLRERLATDFPEQPTHRNELAKGLFNVGNIHRDLGRNAEAEREYLHCLGVFERLIEEFAEVTEYREDVVVARQDLAAAHNQLGILYREWGKLVDAEAQCHRALALLGQLPRGDGPDEKPRSSRAGVHSNLGNVLANLQRHPEAEAEYRKAISLLEQHAAAFPDNPDLRMDLAGMHNNLATILDQPEKVETECRRALALMKAVVAEYTR